MATREPGFFDRQVLRARRFILDLRPPGGPGLTVACGGIERCTPDYRVERPGFPWFGLELVLAGTGRIELAGALHPLSPGSLFCYGPRIPHRIESDRTRPLLKAFLDLGGDEAASLLTGSGLPPGGLRQAALSPWDRDLLDLLVSAGLEGGPAAPRVCAALARALVESLGARAVAQERTREPAWETWRRCRDRIASLEDPTADLAAAAAACGVSPGHLCRLFRRYDRSTPMALLRRRRLQQAAERLSEPGTSLTRLAAELGYSDQFHFSRAFSRAFGQPPSRMRR